MSKGTAKKIIDGIITARAKGVESAMKSVKTILKLKGVNPDQYTLSTPDDPDLIKRLRDIAKEMNVDLATVR